MPQISKTEWDEFYRSHPEASFLQSGNWGSLKEDFGWQAVRFIYGDCGAQVLIRNGPLGIRMGYIPKGPVGSRSNEILEEITLFARRMNCFTLTVEADEWDGVDFSFQSTTKIKLGRNIQPRRTILVSLEGQEEDWLARMKQKTRYNIRLAQKKEVKVSETNDIRLFHRLMEKTGKRDGFEIHSLAYYQKVYDLFRPTGECVILLAEFEGTPLGALLVMSHGKRAWYVYGASNDQERSRMPTYSLQWEAMRWAAGRGCSSYDLWGIPDEDEEILESQFESRGDGLWGVYRFKRGFGGEIKRAVQAMDIVIKPRIYFLYRSLIHGSG
jgi:peptidoglycan pentaglycine glycine transferase (the first glycine)